MNRDGEVLVPQPRRGGSVPAAAPPVEPPLAPEAGGESPLAQRALKRLLVSRVSPVRNLLNERDALRRERNELLDEREALLREKERLADIVSRMETWMPPGHFYSPIPNLREVKEHEQRIFDRSMVDLPGIDMNQEAQLALVREAVELYPDADFAPTPTEGKRYYYENDQFPFSDAFFLYFMMRHFRPKRIVEIGSGYSSSVMMDTNDRHFDGSIELTFIEPYPQRLLRLMSESDHQRATLIRKKCQEVDASVYSRLEPGDFLFIDSSHVSKTGSDVNHLVFEVLPALPPGVIVHFHDVPYPFEYGPEWVYEGRAWNEAYVVRAFLQYNRSFEVLLYPSYLATLDGDYAREHLPLCMQTLGPSLWLRKTGE